MDIRNRKTRVGGLLAIAAAGVVGMMLPASARAASIYIDSTLATGTGDAQNTSSFNNSFVAPATAAPNFWVGGGAPTSGNDYYAQKNDVANSAFLIRTPQGATGTITFAGDSLHLTKVGSNLSYKSATDSVVSVKLVMDPGSQIVTNTASQNMTLAGTLTVNGTSSTIGNAAATTINPVAAGFVFSINSNLIGSSSNILLFSPGNGGYAFGGDNSGFSGTIYTQRPTVLTSNNAIGAGRLFMGNSGVTTVTLNSALALGSGMLEIQNTTGTPAGAVNLNFDGTLATASVGSLKFGGTTYTTGVFGATGAPGVTQLYTTDGDAVFTGSGLLTVPEPTSMGLLGLSALAMLRRRRA